MTIKYSYDMLEIRWTPCLTLHDTAFSAPLLSPVIALHAGTSRRNPYALAQVFDGQWQHVGVHDYDYVLILRIPPC